VEGLPLRAMRLDRQFVGLVSALLALAVVGWLVTDRRMAGMDAGPGTDLGAFGFYVSVWVVMMAAMMFPSIAPMVLTFARVQARRRELRRGHPPRGGTILFVAGYLASWTAFGIGAYVLFAFVRSLSLGALAWHTGGLYVAGAVIAAAAIYQLTPMKDVCLRKCRGPLDFVLGSWKNGHAGAVKMGVEHGLWCVGCCWALMAALFALGVMSLTWMVLIAIVIATEKLLTRPAVAVSVASALLLALALGVALFPGQVPALTIPG
jgi:predicted metal-binding membrane protein